MKHFFPKIRWPSCQQTVMLFVLCIYTEGTIVHGDSVSVEPPGDGDVVEDQSAVLALSIPLDLDESVLRAMDDNMRQKFLLFKANMTCQFLMETVMPPNDTGLYCEPVWDGVMCWPNYYPAGHLATQPCAPYVKNFNNKERATRYCTEDGTWQTNPNTKFNNHWTDYNRCRPILPPMLFKEHLHKVSKLSTVGYSLSLAALTVATFIMIYFKKLHCQRNTIHINLFISFILRALISLLKNSLLVNDFALPSDLDNDNNFIPEGTHWQCKLLFTVWFYSLVASYMWIFVEGLYLHTLIFFAVFSQSRKFFKIYIITGWVVPLIFVFIWVMVRIFKRNVLCWNTHEHGYYWILHGAIAASITVNFFFFLNIIRVLFTKIRDDNTRDPRRYRKLAKSTLVLIPLFGVYYLVFLVLDNYKDPTAQVIYMYMEMTINSFQGMVVALLFCFLNGEVRREFTKRWHRHWLRRQSVASGRSSRAYSVTSFFNRERHSVSQGQASPSEGIALKDSHHIGSSPNGTNTTCGSFGCNPFPKVASMPKIQSHNNSLMPVSPGNSRLPRVSSSPKVTFCCTDSITETTLTSPNPDGQGSARSNVLAVFEAGVDSENPGQDEATSLLRASEPNSPGDKENNRMASDANANKTLVSSFKGSRLIKDCASSLLPEEGRSILKPASSMNGLPPLANIEEDEAKSVKFCN